MIYVLDPGREQGVVIETKYLNSVDKLFNSIKIFKICIFKLFWKKLIKNIIFKELYRIYMDSLVHKLKIKGKQK